MVFRKFGLARERRPGSSSRLKDGKRGKKKRSTKKKLFAKSKFHFSENNVGSNRMYFYCALLLAIPPLSFHPSNEQRVRAHAKVRCQISVVGHQQQLV